jgi:hypothetical protein
LAEYSMVKCGMAGSLLQFPWQIKRSNSPPNHERHSRLPICELPFTRGTRAVSAILHDAHPEPSHGHQRDFSLKCGQAGRKSRRRDERVLLLNDI